MMAGTAAQIAGTVQQGVTAQHVAGYNATVARTNAEAERQAAEAEATQFDYSAAIAEQDAQIAEAAAAFRVRQSTILSARRQGMARALIGASGVTMQGSPLMVLLDNAHEAEIERQLQQYQGQLQALAKRREAQQLAYSAEVRRVTGQRQVVAGEQQALLQQYSGDAVLTGSVLGGVGALARGVGRYYGQKYPKTLVSGATASDVSWFDQGVDW